MDTHMALSHRSNGKLKIQPKAPLKRSKSGAALRGMVQNPPILGYTGRVETAGL